MKERRTRQRVGLFRAVHTRVRKGLSAPPSLPCLQLLGPVWSLGGGTAPLLHQSSGPITTASSPPGEELLLGLTDLGAMGHA